jgi:DNA primase
MLTTTPTMMSRQMDTATGNDLVAVLERLGVDITTVGETEVGGRCPVHLAATGKEDHSPSWSMNSDTGLWLCYACGSRGNLSQLVAQLTGTADDALVVNELLIESGLARLKERLEDSAPPPAVDLTIFRRFVSVPEQLLEYRKLDADVAYHFGIRWDPQPRHWIIPIVAPNGDLWGWQAKAPGYFRNVPTGVTKSHTLFGIERFRAKTAVLLESPLDVVRLSSVRLGMGVHGLASFGAHVSNEQLNLLTHHADIIVIALDNDEAGICAAERVARDCPRPRGGINFLRYEHTNAKDIGDMTDDEITEALTGASALPWWL